MEKKWSFQSAMSPLGFFCLYLLYLRFWTGKMRNCFFHLFSLFLCESWCFCGLCQKAHGFGRWHDLCFSRKRKAYASGGEDHDVADGDLEMAFCLFQYFWKCFFFADSRDDGIFKIDLSFGAVFHTDMRGPRFVRWGILNRSVLTAYGDHDDLAV